MAQRGTHMVSDSSLPQSVRASDSSLLIQKSEIRFSTHLPALRPVFELVLKFLIFALLNTCTHVYVFMSQRNFQMYPLSWTASMSPLGHHTKQNYSPERIAVLRPTHIHADLWRLSDRKYCLEGKGWGSSRYSRIVYQACKS